MPAAYEDNWDHIDDAVLADQLRQVSQEHTKFVQEFAFFKAHTESVRSIQVIEDPMALLTTSSDLSVRLFSP